MPSRSHYDFAMDRASPGARRAVLLSSPPQLAGPAGAGAGGIHVRRARGGLRRRRGPGLDYLPGEVVVKFKEGVTPDGQQRALDALRSRPPDRRLEWAGEVAILRDRSQPDARVLAEQLASQPEVEYAEPNYLRHKTLTPNDTGYAPRQWNLQTLDLPRAWDINPGAQRRASSSPSSTPASPR